MPDLTENRMAVIPVLTGLSKHGYLGRTAVMKYIYFLQVLREVPLGYRFTLYSYGPFDAEVLADLARAEGMGVVESSPVFYPGGYGYEIRPGPRAKELEEGAAEFLERYGEDIRWVCERFGAFNSAQLELASTIVFVDREFGRSEKGLRLQDVITTVRDVKPRFAEGEVIGFAEQLLGWGLLRSRN